MHFVSTSTASIFVLNSFRNTLLHRTEHERFMHLKIFVDSDDQIGIFICLSALRRM